MIENIVVTQNHKKTYSVITQIVKLNLGVSCAAVVSVSGRKFIWFSFLIFAPILEEVSTIPFPIHTHTRTNMHTCKAEVVKGVVRLSHPSSGTLVKV